MGPSTRRRDRRALLAAGAVAVGILLRPLPGASQAAGGEGPRTEAQRLRAAAALEWRGRLDQAQAALEGLLRTYPTSSAGLFSLERILRNRDRVAGVLPWADALLEERPDDSAVRYMKLRVLAEVDSLSALPDAAEAWYAAEPGSVAPYREVARVYARSLGRDRALDELRRGRDAVGDDPALSLATGDLLAEMGQPGAAVTEWSRALRDTTAELGGVLRRVRGLEGGDAGIVAPLIRVLVDEPSTADRRITALRVSLELGSRENARSLARTSLDGLQTQARADYLDAVARVAEEENDPALALWALERRRVGADGGLAVTLDLRMASAALQAGDTAAAVDAQTRLTESLPRGSAERRRVLGELLRVQAASASAETLANQLADFARDFPDAAELDGLRARAGAGVAARGDTAGARKLLEGADGPLVARERGFLQLAEGEVDTGLGELERAVAGVPPLEATRLLETVTLLSRVDGPAREAVARAAAAVHRGQSDAALAELTTTLGSVSDEVRPAVMAWAAARAAESGKDARARTLYTGLVDAYPDAPGFPDAALALARIHLAAGETGPARTLLRRVLVDHPQSPVAPAARRELQRLPRGGEVGR